MAPGHSMPYSSLRRTNAAQTFGTYFAPGPQGTMRRSISFLPNSPPGKSEGANIIPPAAARNWRRDKRRETAWFIGNPGRGVFTAHRAPTQADCQRRVTGAQRRRIPLGNVHSTCFHVCPKQILIRGAVPNAIYQAEWFDPRTGQWLKTGNDRLKANVWCHRTSAAPMEAVDFFKTATGAFQ